jgi:endogenous inhibitor of DNA gyrase (YacG/DUF329 family)
MRHSSLPPLHFKDIAPEQGTENELMQGTCRTCGKVVRCRRKDTKQRPFFSETAPAVGCPHCAVVGRHGTYEDVVFVAPVPKPLQSPPGRV